MSKDQRRTIEDWLSHTYRSIIHRHNDTYIASDESERLFIAADTLADLADYLARWPRDTLPLPPSKFIKVNA